MDPIFLARLQFALTIGFHFIFPPITIGLAWLLVIVEWLGWKRDDVVWQTAGRFFARLFALTFSVGVATGIVMEFQFGTNWASYSKFVGDIFGAPLAAEGVFAFFLESSFLGLFLFGRGRVSKGVHWFSILMVAVGATISAFWIIVANSWQQTPQGFVLQNGRAELLSFADAVLNPSTWPRFFHTMTAALVTGAFFMAGVSAYLLLKGKSPEVAQHSLKLSLVFAFLFSIAAVFPTGDSHAKQVAATQPEKFAAIEGIYQTTKGAGLVLLGIPAMDPPRILGRVELPKFISLMVTGDPDGEVKGLDAFPAGDVPGPLELVVTFTSFHLMAMLGGLFFGMSGLGLVLWWRGKLDKLRLYLWGLVLVAPLPVIACELGWITAEVGRQPWIVYKMLRVEDAASKVVSAGEILFSIILFGAIYSLLGVLWLFLLKKKIDHGPAPLGAKKEVA